MGDKRGRKCELNVSDEEEMRNDLGESRYLLSGDEDNERTFDMAEEISTLLSEVRRKSNL